MSKFVPINENDFSLFGAELSGHEFEYFCKHMGAFRRMFEEESKQRRKGFVAAFSAHSYQHLDIKAVVSMSDPKRKFIEQFCNHVNDAYINAKFNTAKQFMHDAYNVARNRHMIQFMDSRSYAKDPFFRKDTRDSFRRLFGEPNEAGTCVKVVCILPLFVRFAGSVCRYLKRWLDVEKTLTSVATVSDTKSKAEKKAMKSKLRKGKAQREPSIRSPAETEIRTEKKKSEEHSSSRSESTCNTKANGPDGDSKANIDATIDAFNRFADFYCYMKKHDPKRLEPRDCKPNCPGQYCEKHHCLLSITDDLHDNHYIDHVDFEECQFPTLEDGNDCLYDEHKAMVQEERILEEDMDKLTMKCDSMNLKSARNELDAINVIRVNNTDKENDEGHNSDDKMLNGQNFIVKTAEENACDWEDSGVGHVVKDDGNDFEFCSDVMLEDPNVQQGADELPDGDISRPECNEDVDDDKADVLSGSVSSGGFDNLEDYEIRGETPVVAVSGEENFEDFKFGNKPLLIKASEEENGDDFDFESKTAVIVGDVGENFENFEFSQQHSEIVGSECENLENFDFGRKTPSEGEIPQDSQFHDAPPRVESLKMETYEDSVINDNKSQIEKESMEGEYHLSNESGNEPVEVEYIMDRKDHMRARHGYGMKDKYIENELFTSDDSDDVDHVDDERFLRESLPEMHLCEPHPNEQYERLTTTSRVIRKKRNGDKIRKCSFCRRPENEGEKFKKCQKCKGKGTKFYCSRECQKKDWRVHRVKHAIT
ncbi:uncharacterized protein LOC124448741 [Xenia sp. Carnegie-2017]|uniref:uncharacterized protein LOC124448741 n=1 Tax=Xenia sp. Carnegie-2017 TaxID=2897299 RepID=UPI001F04BB6B|nr:uncharacterized protein LOC124448741 [Xenia sp. Carnegie-2017]